MEPLVQIQNLSWRYSVGDWVLKDITLSISKGERLGLVGRSGSGKSTLALTLNGIIPQSSAGVLKGSVMVGGNDATTIPIDHLAKSVAMVFQSPDDQMSQILTYHEIASGPANLRLPLPEVRQRVNAAMAQLQITHLAERETTNLSGGEKQKVAVAAALAMKPELLVLDEPTTDLDPRAKWELIESLKNLGDNITIVVISHDIDTILPLTKRLVVMDHGKIVADASSREILSRPDILKNYGIGVPKKLGFSGVNKPNGHHQDASVTIEVRNVHFRYPLAENEAVSGLSLTVRKREMVAIVGNNGSGKTTLGKLILGLIKPDSGQVKVSGEEVHGIRADRVGYIYQNPDAMLSQMTALEEVAFTPKNLGHPDWKERTNRTLENFGLQSLTTRFPLSLSKGQRQKLAYAAVTSAEPSIMIFDEPTTGIDAPACEEIMKYMDSLRHRGHTILFITHDMRLALEWADTIIVMNSGKAVFQGNPESLLQLDRQELTNWHLLPTLARGAKAHA